MREHQDNHYRGSEHDHNHDHHDRYVEKIHWLVHTGREDLIDEIADEYERPLGSRSARLRGWPSRHLRSVG